MTGRCFQPVTVKGTYAMQMKDLLATPEGERDPRSGRILGVSPLQIGGIIFFVLAFASVITDPALNTGMAKILGYVPPQIVTIERGNLVLVRAADTSHPLQSSQLESFEFVWQTNNPKERLVQVMRDGSVVLYRAEKK